MIAAHLAELTLGAASFAEIGRRNARGKGKPTSSVPSRFGRDAQGKGKPTSSLPSRFGQHDAQGKGKLQGRTGDARSDRDAYFKQPFYVSQQGHMAGYKVHVGDLPGAWSPEQIRHWAHGVLSLNAAQLPTDTNTGMGHSDYGRSQTLLTFPTSDQAKSAQRLLSGVRNAQAWPERSLRSNAAYWVPRGYDPWAQDPMWPGLPSQR